MGEEKNDTMNKIFSLLGGIQSDVTHIKSVADKTETKLDNHTVSIAKLEMRTKSAHKRIDAHNVVVEDYKKLKQRGFGIAMIIGFIASGVTTVGFYVIDKFFT